MPWQLTGVSGGGHTVKMVYTLNNSTAFSADSINGRKVSMYYTTINSDFSQTLHANGYYTAGALTVTVAEDENWVSGRAGTVEEYKDIDGHVVLKRQYNYTGSAVQVLSTYYIYDDMGRLAFVLPPTAGADGDGTISTATLKNLCYQYRYDERGRPEAKRLPGKGWEYVVYNIMDQPVATQDSLQGIAKQWIFTKYDDRQRVVMTGIWNNGGTSISRASLQSTLNGISTNLWESATTTGNGYTNVAWPTTNVTTTLSINYYDGYTMPGLPSAYTAPSGANLATRAELTGTQTNVLGTSNMLWTAHYYDYWGRSLEAYAQHYLNGTLNSNNYDAITSTYNFTNAPTTVTRKHWTSASTSYPLVTVFNKYIYDWVGRKDKTWEQITNKNLAADTMRLVSLAIYNEIGQLAYKKLHSKDSVNYIQAINYLYNERGWLRQASAPLFNLVLSYNADANKAYNGNIMYQFWGVPGNLSNHYTYTYDKLNRLKSGITSADNFQESGITYDTEGNLTALNRYQSGTEIDQLTYYYNSKNSLDSVKDANGSNAGLVSGTTKYTYDGNGNMVTAANTANTGQNKSFTYNLLNLPSVVTIPSGTYTYTYDAAGNKLRMVKVISGVTTNTDYIGGLQYNGNSTSDTLNFIQTEEGKAVKRGNGINYEYIYYLGDNLGNTRITMGTLAGTTTVDQQDDYYPFGLEITRIAGSPKNEYLYNKKELQEDFTEYDYGARFYDPVIGRWTSVDPWAEVNQRWSPYNYVENDPIRRIDPDGMKPMDAETREGLDQAEALFASFGAKVPNGGTGEQQQQQPTSKQGKGTHRDIYVHNRDGSIARNSDGSLHVRPDVLSSIQKQLDKIAFIENLAGAIGMIKSSFDSFFPKEQAVDKEEDQSSGGAARAKKYSSGWGNASLNDAISKFAPDAEAVQNGSKIVYKNDETGVQVVYDEAGNYFRIQDTKVSGRRQYLDMNGKIPNNKVANGKQTGRSQAEYNQATHFNNHDN